MQFTEKQAAEVKGWVVKRLEDISDADSDVLADYVLALIRSDAPDEDIRKASVENLEDFLKENTTSFVDEIFAKYNPKTYQPVLPTPDQPTSHTPTPVAQQLLPQSIPFQQQTNAPEKWMPSGHGQSMNQSPPNRSCSFEAGGATSNFSRKRAFNEGPQAGEEQDSHYNRADRPFKSLRGRRGGRGDNRMVATGSNINPNTHNNNHARLLGIGGYLNPNQQQQQQHGGFQRMPPVRGPPHPSPTSFPPFNPNDPIATMIALQAMGFPQIPGMPPLPQIATPTGAPGPGPNRAPRVAGSPPASIPRRCRDYDTQGFCVLGSTCPFQHGTDHLVAPARDDEYDPTKSNIVLDRPLSSNATNGHGSSGLSRGSERGRGRGRGRGDRGGFNNSPRRNRADFSQAGPNEDRSITTIVVEQIPEDKFDEKIVRDFFSEFGNIVEVTMQPYRHLALVKYDTWAAARRAWASPKVIFDNRFVKVYWYKQPTAHKAETNGTGTSHHPFSQSPAGNRPDMKPFDQEEFERQQAEAQRQHEEKMRKRKETEEARLALEKQKEDLLKRQQEEKANLLHRLGAQQHQHDATATTNGRNGTAHRSGDSEMGQTTSPSPADGNVSEQTKLLREQLAALEAEAKSLGLDPSSPDSRYPSRGRGRGWRGGSYRGGRGAYDAAFASFRGGYRGMAAGPPRGRGGVLRLDNRPKRVAVSGVEFSPERDEALRQFLLGVGEYESIEPNPDQPDSQIISFKDRYVAEKLMYGPSEIPSIGKVEFTWVANNSTSSRSTRAGSVSASASSSAQQHQQQQHQQQAEKGGDDDAVMGNGGHHNETDSMLRKDAGGAHEVDYDVAEMDDAWEVE
ncbi:uncharacterized protein PADG_08124 [Paracoccidioides brasiliensis Pb18]|uniref:C3H1-type domain-containing protein n=1 Tax=Paracoccidioides brasiliensis (strain Pb18) TaxID=502780 RepID=C1GLI8_PARBD|nr:uncharacterized protein PADG_08124 [Paracoccidioides brasiliensis Pb18]EEH43304.2 hypothetical protein PADG_08124 [Paracoccidioides brasiliensis Pb18]